MDLPVDHQFMTASTDMVEHLCVCHDILFVPVAEGSKCFID